MFSALKYLFYTLLFLLFFFCLPRFAVEAGFSFTAHAQDYAPIPQKSDYYQSNYDSSSLNSNVPRNQHTHVQATIIELMSATICQLAGIDVINPQQGCLGIDTQTRKLGFAPTTNQRDNGLIGFSASAIGSLYSLPIHSLDYVHYLSQNFGISKSVFAEENIKNDSASVGISPLIKFWTEFRNIAYLLLVLIFVFIGIGIMLRIKIDPRTVMSIQNQIPKIVIGIILITFSYAIAGFMVDAMWVATSMGTNLLAPKSQCKADDPNSNANFTEKATNTIDNPIMYMRSLLGSVRITGDKDATTKCFGRWSGLGGLANDLGSTIGKAVEQIILGVAGLDLNSASADTQCNFFRHPLDCLAEKSGDAVKYGAYALTRWLVHVAGLIIVLAALFVALFRVWISLIKAYVRIIIYIIFAPIWILAGMLPRAGSLNFDSWLRAIGSNLLLFPVTVFLFIIAARFAAGDAIEGSMFIPPLVGSVGDEASAAGTFIAFGIIMITPEIINNLREALKSKPSDFGQRIGKGFQGGAAPVSGFAGGLWGSMWAKDAYNRPRGFAANWAKNKMDRWSGLGSSTTTRNPIRRLAGGFRKFKYGDEKNTPVEPPKPPKP